MTKINSDSNQIQNKINSYQKERISKQKDSLDNLSKIEKFPKII